MRRKYLSSRFLVRWSFGALRPRLSAADKPKDFPNRPITIMVGFGAGGSSDVGVRILARGVEEGHRADRSWWKTSPAPAAR